MEKGRGDEENRGFEGTDKAANSNQPQRSGSETAHSGLTIQGTEGETVREHGRPIKGTRRRKGGGGREQLSHPRPSTGSGTHS